MAQSVLLFSQNRITIARRLSRALSSPQGGTHKNERRQICSKQKQKNVKRFVYLRAGGGKGDSAEYDNEVQEMQMAAFAPGGSGGGGGGVDGGRGRGILSAPVIARGE